MPKNRARKRELMEFDILKSLSGSNPEEIAESVSFTQEEAKVITGAMVAVQQALELLKQKGMGEEALDISKEILVGNVSVTTETKEIPFGIVTTKLPFGTVYVGPSNFDGEPGIMEEILIKNITTGEEKILSQVVVKAPVPAQQIAMEEDPNKINSISDKPQINSIGDKPPFNYHPHFPHRPGAQFDSHPHQSHLRPKGLIGDNDHLRTEDHFDSEVGKTPAEHQGRDVTIEDILEAIGNGREIRFVPMHEELPGHPPKFSPEQLRSMSIARELERENEQSQGFEAFKNFLGLQ